MEPSVMTSMILGAVVALILVGIVALAIRSESKRKIREDRRVRREILQQRIDMFVEKDKAAPTKRSVGAAPSNRRSKKRRDVARRSSSGSSLDSNAAITMGLFSAGGFDGGSSSSSGFDGGCSF